jgi:DNA sulfur modification protein DndB
MSSVYRATNSLLRDFKEDSGQLAGRAIAFWNEVGGQFPEWKAVKSGSLSAQDVRTEYLHSHGVVLQAIGRAGNALLHADPDGWAGRLKGLSAMDWSRKNPFWEGRVMIGGRVSKAEANVVLTVAAIKRELGLELSSEEGRLEEHLRASGRVDVKRGNRGR